MRKEVRPHGGRLNRNFVLVGSTGFVFFASLRRSILGVPEATSRAAFGVNDVRVTL